MLHVERPAVSVILMTYAEKDSIRAVIEGFYATGVVDEVLVVNNNAQAGTAEEVAQTPARQVFEPQQGYGYASRRGLTRRPATCSCSPSPTAPSSRATSSSCSSTASDCDAVFGTRTTRELIWHGANMGWFLRWGNWAVAKLVEVLFNTSHLSDVGCTYRLFTRETRAAHRRAHAVGGSHFGPEMMLLTITSGARFVEVPVNYLPRVGTSSVTGDLLKAIRLGMRMIGFILRFRLRTPRRMPRPDAARRSIPPSASRP